MTTTLVFIHGRDARHGDWLAAIDQALDKTGRPHLGERVRTLAVDYGDLLHEVIEGHPEHERTRHPAWADFRAQQHAVAESLAPYTDRLLSPFDFFPKEWVTRRIMDRMPEVERYRLQPEVRRAVRARLLEQLPDSGDLVLVAHSLGSVVAFDLVHYLPPELSVELLLTIGSPMARKPWRNCLADLGGTVPTGIVRSWVNVVNRGDWVTGGDGLRGCYPQAVDTYARLGLAVHGETKYLASYPAGVAIGDALARLTNRVAH